MGICQIVFPAELFFYIKASIQYQSVINLASIVESRKICRVLKIIADYWTEAPSYHRESAAWNSLCGVLASFILIKSYICGGWIQLLSHVLLNGYLENVFATSMPEAKLGAPEKTHWSQTDHSCHCYLSNGTNWICLPSVACWSSKQRISGSTYQSCQSKSV